MKLSSIQLEAFFSLSKLLNFSKAAADLNITQSALSQRIFNLEQALETNLIIRDPAGARLTESGLTLLRYCQTQFALEEEVLSLLAQPKTRSNTQLAGTIRIGGFSSVMRSLVLPKLGPLIKNHLEIKLEAFVRELSELPTLLKQGQIDFAVLDRILDHSDVKAVKIGEEENVLTESRNTTTRKDYYLDHDPEDRTTERFFEYQGKPLPKGYKRSYLDDVYGIIDGVTLGWGRAVLPSHLVRSNPEIRILSGFKPLKSPIVLHFYKQSYYSRLHQEVLRCFETP